MSSGCVVILTVDDDDLDLEVIYIMKYKCDRQRDTCSEQRWRLGKNKKFVKVARYCYHRTPMMYLHHRTVPGADKFQHFFVAFFSLSVPGEGRVSMWAKITEEKNWIVRLTYCGRCGARLEDVVVR